MKKRIFASLLVCSLTLTVAVAPSTASAENIDQKIEQKDKEISDLKAQQSDLASQVSSLEADIADIINKSSELLEEQTTLQSKSDQLKKDIETLNQRIEKREAAIKNQARDVQVNGQSTTFIDAVLNAESISDAIGRVHAFTTIVSANNDLINQQKADKQAVVDKEAENEQKLQELEVSKAELDTKRADFATKQSSLNVLRTSLELEQATAEGTKADLQQQKSAAEAEQARIAAAQKEAAEKAKAEKTAAATAESSAASSTASSETAQSSTDSSETAPSIEVPNTGGSTNTGNESNNSGNTGGGIVESGDATFMALNAKRVANGLNPVSWDAGLAGTASARASLISATGGIPSDHWSRGDEVIAMGFAPGAIVINAWYNEENMVSASGSGHRDWEMNPGMTRVGFGYYGGVIVGHSG
ncbi:coiled-coil domain-containing protein [Enterococcus sp. LJL51]|uniref:coiled-coil domain-containing protein n=1 Tax=Enterococcus sp. LJL51 TaxID=3416656 RepID=UPI003CF5AE09